MGLTTKVRGDAGNGADPKSLYGIFGEAQWTNKDRLPDSLLRDLMEHFSRPPLGNKSIRADVLGDAYEYLIKKFADATNKKAGEFCTPRAVVRLMVNILNPKAGETIHDPTCRTGGMLLEAVHHVRETGGEVRTLQEELYDREKSLAASAIARINLFLHGIKEERVSDAVGRLKISFGAAYAAEDMLTHLIQGQELHCRAGGERGNS